MTKTSLGRKTFLAFISFILLGASVALASIVVGTSTTSVSNDVAYTLVTLSKPIGTTAGETLIANVSVNGGSGAVVTPPNGWTLIGRTDNDSNIGIVSYWKVIGASEPASYTWTISPQTRAAGGITRYSGVDTASPVDVMAGSIGRGGTAIAPSIITTKDNDRVIALFATNVGTNPSSLFATTTGWIKRYDLKYTPFGPTIAAEDNIQTLAGSVGQVLSTFSTSQRDWAAQIIALKVSTELQNGLVAYWKMDGNSVDVTGNGNSGIDTSVTYNGGVINQSATYGNAPSVTTVSDSANLDFTTGLTVAGWINPGAYSDANPNYLATKTRDTSWGSGNGGQWILRLNNATTIEGGIKIGGSQHGIGNNLLSFPTGTWAFIAMTYDGSNIKLYVNGSEVASVSQTGNIDAGQFPLYLGNNPLGNEYISHSIDEVGLWSRALSVSEISQLYNGGAGFSYPF